MNPEAAICRYPTCVRRREILAHILQRCPVTHYPRIQGHDRTSQDLIARPRKKGLNVQEAPRISIRDNCYIPDIIVVDGSDGTGNIIETTIIWDHKDSLLQAARMKRDKHNLPEILDSMKEKYNLKERPEVLPFVVGARGCWAPSNEEIWKRYNLPRYLERTVVCNVLRYGTSIHKYFMAHI